MVKQALSNKFFIASFWMYAGTLLLNIGNYVYHLLAARLLGRNYYGELESLISLVYMLSIPWMTLTLVVIKFVSMHKGKDEIKEISKLYYYLKEKLIIYGLIFGLILLIISPWIMTFLHVSSYLSVVFLIAVFFFGILSMLNRSFLQGMSDFFALAVSNSLEAVGKVFTAIILIYFGYKVAGAFAAIAISIFIGFFIANYYVRKLKFSVKGSIDVKRLVKYILPVFLTTFGMTSLFTTDVILVRHFFPGVESGSYAALSVLGKIIFFGVSPIMFVMFPFVSENYERGKKYIHFLFISLALSAVGGFIICLAYFFIPELIVGLLFGNEYVAISELLGFFGIFISLYTLCYLLSSFYLSIHKTVVSLFVALAALLQVIFIVAIHESLFQIIIVNIVIVFLLIIGLLLYYPYIMKINNGRTSTDIIK